MNKLFLFLNKVISIFLVFFIIFIILNNLYIIDFSDTIKSLLYFLTVILILISATKEIIINKSGLIKFINCVILFTFIVGGIFFITNKSLNFFIYTCILFSFIYGFVDLIYKKA